MKMRIITLMSLCLVTFTSVNAQIRMDPFYPYSKWTVGAGFGFSEIYGNLNKTTSEPMLRINVDRNINAWVYIDFSAWGGSFSDYETKNHWTNGLNVYNQVFGGELSGRIAVGEFFKFPCSFFAKTLFGIYGGVGIGYMANNVSNITLKFRRQDTHLITDYNSKDVQRHTTNAYLPLTLGWNLHLTKRCMLNINYEFCYAFSDYLDGYNFPQPTAHNYYNDMFSVLTFGLHFYVGHVGMVKHVHNDEQKRKAK
jgi:hypothetical protein